MMENEWIQLTDKAIAVEVPQTAYDFQIPEKLSILWYMMPPLRGYSVRDLPKGSWSILGKGNELSMDQIYKVIEGTGLTFNQLLDSHSVDKSKILILVK